MIRFKADNDILYLKPNFKIEEGVTMLIGANGTGKTTLLLNIKSYLERNKKCVVYFDMLNDARLSKQWALDSGNIQFLADTCTSSEGEGIVFKLGLIVKQVSTMMSSKKAEEIYLLLDNFDNDLSIDAMQDFKNYFIKNTLDSMKEHNRHFYLIMSVNHYEILEGQRCLDVRNNEFLTFETYDNYREWVLKSRKQKEERLE